MRSRTLITVALVLFASYGVLADVRTEQKTQVQFGGMLGRVMNLFGGKAAREGITSTVLVKGDRKVTATDNTSQIIDLSEEKVYDLDLRRRAYKVTTFAEMRRQIEEAQRRAEDDARRQQERGSPEAAEGDQREVEVDFDVKNTGETRTINGFDTKQALVIITVREKGKTLDESGGLVLTSDMWLAPQQAALKEVEEFDRRYADKLYGGLAGVSADQMAMAVAMYPMLRQAMERLSAEGDKIEGTAILTTLTFDAVRSAEQVKSEAKDEAQPTTGRGIGGVLGGLARRARKPADEEPKQRTTFMSSTVEVLNVSTDVPADAVAVPPGFKESK
ncbi:MAG TPA: hypothetical protein VMO26_20370 [Vicinamibacterales bacterium]|nr:hypothetical protein [Vicinamibacterales bacterium]